MSDDWKCPEWMPAPKVEGFTVLCELPRALGSVTKLQVKNGRVVAETESGIDFLAPELPKS